MQTEAHWHTGMLSAHCTTCAGLPWYIHQRFGSLTGTGPRLQALIVMMESPRLWVIERLEASLDKHIALQSLRLRHLDCGFPSHPAVSSILNLPTFCLESFYLAEYGAWQYTETIIRLLFWYSEALTQFCFVPQGALLQYIASEHNSKS